MKLEFTHFGWLGFCPCHFGGLNSDAPNVRASRWYLEPLLVASTFMFQFIGGVASFVNPDFEPGFPLQVHGPLDKPYTLDINQPL